MMAIPLPSRARTTLSALSFSGFDTTTAEGRARERERRVALSTVASIAAQSLSILSALVSVPLALGYLGAERFGMWMTITAAVTMLTFADLGIGNGLLNAVAAAHGRDDRSAAREAISSALLLMSGLSLLLLAVFAILYTPVPWVSVLNVGSSRAASEAGPAVAVVVCCFLANLPLGIVEKIQLAYQEGFINSIWTAAGNLGGLVGVVLAIQLGASLPWLVLAVAGSPVLARLFNGVVLFGRRRPWLRPRLALVSRGTARSLFQVGMLFFVLQLAIAVAFQSDSIVAAQITGPSSVTDYAVTFRLFSIVPLFLALALTPLWPAYREAIVRNDMQWVGATLKRSLRLTLLATVPVAIVLMAAGRTLIHLWAGDQAHPSTLLIVGFGLWMMISPVGNAIAMFLNGAHIVRFQVVAATIMALTNLALSIVLAHLIGVAGVIWGTVICFTVCALIPSLLYAARLLKEFDRREASPQIEPRTQDERLLSQSNSVEGGPVSK